MSSPFDKNALSGKVALITGGGSGICFEIARQFGLHGCKVAIMGRREAVLAAAVAKLKEQSINAVFSQGDVRKKEDCERAVQKCVAEFGQLDILVNGAAGNFLAPTEDLSTNAFKAVLDIDAVGTFNMCLAAKEPLARSLSGQQGASYAGLIINISATLHYAATWYQSHVSAAKAAVDALTRNLALEWGTDYGIRANGIAPGPIGDTPGMSKLLPEEVTLRAEDIGPLGRMGETLDIAMAAIFLASDAGKYISGTTIVVDGGGWLNQPRHIPKQIVREISRKVEARSRNTTKQRMKAKL